MPFKIVFLPGWALKRQAYHGLIEVLSDGAEVIYADYRGQSSPDAILDYARGLVQSSGPALVVAHSMGTLPALKTAAELPQLTQGLVLISPTARFTPDQADYPVGFATRILDRMQKKLLQDPQAVLKDFAAGCFSGSEADNASFFSSVIGQMMISDDLPQLTAGLQGLAAWDMRPQLGAVRCPSALVRGSADAICPPGAGDFLAGALKPLQDNILANAGHLPFLSHPGFTRVFLSAVNAVAGAAHAG